MKENVFMKAQITPEKMLAGDSDEIVIRLVAGKEFTAQNSRIIIDTPATFKISRPTCFMQSEDGYVEVYCSNPDIIYQKRIWDIATGEFSYEPAKQGMDSRVKRFFVLDFLGGTAEEGDEILIKWGDIINGFGVGTKMTSTVTLKDYYNTIHVRYFQDGTQGLPDYQRSFKGYDRPIPDVQIPLQINVLPREPKRIRVIRSLQKTSVLVLDRFSNLCCGIENLSDYIVEGEGFVKNQYNVFESKNPNAVVTSKGLDITDAPNMKDVFEGNHIYFGDLHTHSSASNDCIEWQKSIMTPELSYEYGKSIALLDFMAVTDHHQPWDIERNKVGKENWENICATAQSFTKHNEFAAFPGFEFRDERGDTAVVFKQQEPYSDIDIPQMNNVKKLWQILKGKDYITIPHFHNGGSMEANQWYECPYQNVEPILEIYSCHGSYERKDALEKGRSIANRFRPDRCGEYFLKNGYKYGFSCNSDGHIGNPGHNGLTAVYAKSLTPDAIMEAIRKKQVYGTTNARIKLLFTINGQLMGSELHNTEEVNLSISAEGETSIKAVDIFKNGELLHRIKPYEKAVEFQAVYHCDSPSSWYVRVIQIDNHMAYSSPIWVEQ